MSHRDHSTPSADGTAVAVPLSVSREGEVTVVRMTAGENRLNPTMVAALTGALDELERADSPGALVLTGEGKFFSNGLDLEWMGSSAPDEAAELLRSVHRLFARLLAFPTATVAAVNGHAFAAGAMLALACDARVMREDRGYVCLPEVDLGLPFTPGFTALLKARMSAGTARDAMLTGRRYGGHDATTAGLVDAAVAEDRVVPVAIERGAALAAKPRPTVEAIKRALYADAIRALEAFDAPPVLQ